MAGDLTDEMHVSLARVVTVAHLNIMVGGFLGASISKERFASDLGERDRTEDNSG